MNILMYGWELPPQNSGGLGTACYGLSKGLCGLGARVNFVLPKKFNNDLGFMKVWDSGMKDSKFSSWAVNSILKAYNTSDEYQQWLNSLSKEELEMQVFGDDLVDEANRYGKMAGKFAKKIPHQVIHAHDWMSYPAGLEAKKYSGKPFVAHIHATEFDRCAGEHVNGRVAEIEYQGMQKADKVVAVSNFTKQKIMDKYLVPENKIEVVHNGVDAKEFPLSFLPDLLPGYQIVLFVGRLTIQKGADHLLKAIPTVLKMKPKTAFIFAGDGDMKQQLIMEAARLGVGHRVFFPGFIRGHQLNHLYQMADVFVMPSVSEPFGIVPLEALANRKPVIISKQSGVAEVVHHALKVDFWDIKRLSELMIAALSWPELREEMSRNGYREVENLTWDRAAEKMMGVFKCLISN